MIERITPEEYLQKQIKDIPGPEAYLDRELPELEEEKKYVYGVSPEGAKKLKGEKPKIQPVQRPFLVRPRITGTIPFSEFGDTEGSQTVNPGQWAVVYTYEVPSDYVAFMWELALRWWANTYWIWEIDGDTVERIERTVGNMNEPYKLTPRPYKAEEEIRLIAYNNNTEAHEFRAVCNGELVRKIT